MSEQHEALVRLKQGNGRFVAGEVQHPNQTRAQREALVAGQQPFAIVLSCADSRVPPALVFDCGLGDLFVVRVAGGVLGDSVIASLEFAVTLPDVSLLVVLGHTGCGAVKAALGDAPLPGKLAWLAGQVRAGLDVDARVDVWETAVVAHTKHVAQQLETLQPLIASAVAEGSLKIVPALYRLESGVVEWL